MTFGQCFPLSPCLTWFLCEGNDSSCPTLVQVGSFPVMEGIQSSMLSDFFSCLTRPVCPALRVLRFSYPTQQDTWPHNLHIIRCSPGRETSPSKASVCSWGPHVGATLWNYLLQAFFPRSCCITKTCFLRQLGTVVCTSGPRYSEVWGKRVHSSLGDKGQPRQHSETLSGKKLQ